MPIHDLGYRHWEGTRTNLALRWLVITRTGIALAWRSKIVKRLVWLAWVPALYLGFVFFVIGKATENPRSVDLFLREVLQGALGEEIAQEFLLDPVAMRQIAWKLAFYNFTRNLQLWPALVIAGLVGAGLLSRDVKGKTFLLYYSKPITLFEYFLGKALVIVFYVALVTLLPNLALYACSIAFSPSLDVVLYTWDIPLKIISSFLVLVVPVTVFVLFFSSMTPNARYAGFAWFATIIVGQMGHSFLYYQVLMQQQRELDWSVLVSVKEMIDTVIWKIYGATIALGSGGIETARSVTPSIAVLGIVSIFALSTIFRRLSAPVRV